MDCQHQRGESSALQRLNSWHQLEEILTRSHQRPKWSLAVVCGDRRVEGIQQVVYSLHPQFTASQGLWTDMKETAVKTHQAGKTFWELIVSWPQMWCFVVPLWSVWVLIRANRTIFMTDSLWQPTRKFLTTSLKSCLCQSKLWFFHLKSLCIVLQPHCCWSPVFKLTCTLFSLQNNGGEEGV